ncbi:MAG: circadian clock protein KaiB, partial [Verrucomicrobiales bacterium]|nr:circadian clock protein KaiB [Verrucomicrobiales bacterium]
KRPPESEAALNRAILFKFRLYVAGDTRNSARALANLTALCRTHLPERNEIEIVDVLREPKRALKDGIFMTPMLVKLAPGSVEKIIGTLSQTNRVLQALGLETIAP